MSASRDHAPSTDAATASPLPPFTPGPWTLEFGDHTHSYVKVEGEDETTVHYLYVPHRKDLARAEANARLIAAAPDLLAALKEAEGLPSLLAEIADLEAYGGEDDAKPLRALRKDLHSTLAKARAALARVSP